MEGIHTNKLNSEFIDSFRKQWYNEVRVEVIEWQRMNRRN